MIQPDLFDEPQIPAFMPAWRCGDCVHRNARSTSQDLGPCSHHGMRHRTDKACDQFFGRQQLILACAKRP